MRMPWSPLQSVGPVLREAAGSSPSDMVAVREAKGQRILRRVFAEEAPPGSEAAGNKQRRLVSREGARGELEHAGCSQGPVLFLQLCWENKQHRQALPHRAAFPTMQRMSKPAIAVPLTVPPSRGAPSWQEAESVFLPRHPGKSKRVGTDG